jgi:hypothetical protein
MGLQIKVLNASSGPEINAAFANVVRERPDALFVNPRSLLHQPAGATCDAGDAPRDSNDIR